MPDPSSTPDQTQSSPRRDGDPPTPLTGAAAPAPLSPTALPPRVGRYEVRGLIGAGAFGRVYRGYDPKLKREVAIKVPHAAALTAELRERFRIEAEAAAAIHHPNVCPVYDVDTDGEVPFLVMRFVPGKTLARVIAERSAPFPAPTAAKIVGKLARGVAAAHAQNVLHRDLKPDNVLWDESIDEVLVTDFGIARVSGAARLTRTSYGPGTPAYMSPEQWRGKSAEIGPPTDVYGLGVILYRLVTGVLPFEGDSPWEVMAKVYSDEPRPPSAVRPGLDARVDVLCARAVAKQVADRYPSAKAFADALADFLRAAALGGDDLTRDWDDLQSAAPGGDPLPFYRERGPGRVRAWEQWARANHPRGMVLYAHCLREGIGGAEDGPAAVSWYRRAAELDEPAAMYHLGVCHATGRGVARDEAGAVGWYRRAAEKDYAPAMCNLGACHIAGRGVARDEAGAVGWFRRAAEKGDATAMYNLGVCYAKARGVGKDEAEAAGWYRRAAEKDEPLGMHNLAACYETGRGVAGDAAEAVRWYRRAADRGYEPARQALARLGKS